MEIELQSTLKVNLVDYMGTDASLVAAARVSTQGVAASTEAKEGLINALMRDRHGSPFEHGSMTFMVEAPIFVFREWHRHRVGWSYNEESGRYKVLRPRFYSPPPHRKLIQSGKAMEYKFEPGTQKQWQRMRDGQYRVAQAQYDEYQAQLDGGICREVARMVLGVNIFSSMYATCNPRSLMHFLELRTHEPDAKRTSNPMWEIEVCARKMEQVFATLWPVTWKAWQNNGRMCP